MPRPNYNLFSQFFQKSSAILLTLSLCFFALPANAQGLAKDAATLRAEPEPATQVLETKDPRLVKGKDFMVVTSHPLATDAAHKILMKGGSAADAGIAAQLVLGLTEPQSSGLGGGGFALYYDAYARKLHTFDGRETAPLAADENMFMNEDGTPMSFAKASTGGLPVGVPGIPMLLAKLHDKYGALPWTALFDEPVKIAHEGFEITPRLHELLETYQLSLGTYDTALQYFYDENGKPREIGTLLKNPEYAKTLLAYKNFGATVFYDPGHPHSLVPDIINTTTKDPENPGRLAIQDFQNYRVIERAPVCGLYRSYHVCSMGLPSSGGLTLIEALGILNGLEFENDQTTKILPENLYKIFEATRIAFADRNVYMADPAFVDHPGKELLARDYLAKRRQEIGPFQAIPHTFQGSENDWDSFRIPQRPQEENGTAHISIVDSKGNILSFTTSIEQAFGSKLMVHGFLLNNQLTDFSFIPAENGFKIANRAEPGKRPRSSMTPTIIFDANGKPTYVLGSAGGSRIIGYVLKTIIAMIDWNMPISEALAMPHFVSRSQEPEIDLSTALSDLKPALEERGYKVNLTKMNSGLTGITLKDRRLYGSADPRREGTAKGDKN